ncbi:MAG: DNA polymerase [Caenibius sp.]
MAALEREIHGLAGTEYHRRPPSSWATYCSTSLATRADTQGQSGQYSTDQAVLERLSGEGAEIAAQVLDWRQLTKLKSTYTDALQDAINPETGRVHTSYSLVGAQTGRLSSSDQSSEYSGPHRDRAPDSPGTVAGPGHVLLWPPITARSNCVSPRIWLTCSQQDTLRQGRGYSCAHGRKCSAMSTATRARAKTINFAILYGISRWGLASRLAVEPDEAQAMIDRYFERFPGIQRYIVATLEQESH